MSRATDVKEPPRKNPAMGEGPGAALAQFERYKQMGVAEAQMVYDMTLRNEVSGGTPTVVAFEKEWKCRHNTKFAVTVNNGTAITSAAAAAPPLLVRGRLC
jgi:dTDP-4-amino-4,6-dideoxygalactose transaminase